MSSQELKRRAGTASPATVENMERPAKGRNIESHPMGEIKNGTAKEVVRFFLFTTYFVGCCVMYETFFFLDCKVFVLT
jgi:hypothetical protein